VAAAKPYFDHLLDWDSKTSVDDTRTALCLQWYSELYGRSEKLKPEYIAQPEQKYATLIKAAKILEHFHGTWKVAWGELNRLQRVPNAPSPQTAVVGLSDSRPSIPCIGAPGPLGSAFTVYCTPDNPEFPFKKRYGVVGASFVATYEFGERVKAKTLLQFGVSGNPTSPHFFDQAPLLSEQRLKDAWFYEDEVAADPRIDALRDKMVVSEDESYSKDYYDAEKRYIGNAVQVFFKDGSSTDKVEIHYPVGHRNRREEGLPIMKAKFKKAVEAEFDSAQAGNLVSLFEDLDSLQTMSATDFMTAWVK